MVQKSDQNNPIKVSYQISIRDLALKLGVEVWVVISELMKSGIMATINEVIDFDTALIISSELGFEIELDNKIEETGVLTIEKLIKILEKELENNKNLTKRPPVVTILGHVDHGKTTLLDTLRKTRVADGEYGGITQHIRAYQVVKNKNKITFIDTPGHEAFQAMRERGASIADIAILVVAADDGVKPQTKEVADFLIKNKIPTLIAINKIDKEGARVDKVKQELSEVGVFLEGYGGNIPFVEISAKNNLGLDELLDTVLLLSEMGNYRADFSRAGLGVVLESHKDSQKGSVATVLVKTGVFKVGQDLVVGTIQGKIKKIEDYTGRMIKEAFPSMPVTVFGLNGVPSANDVFQIQDVKIDRKRKKIIDQLGSSVTSCAKATDSMGFIENIDKALMKKYSMVLKSDVQGSLEAVRQILETINSSEIQLDIFRESVGSITETDIQAAQTSQSDVYGFNVQASSVAKRLAETVGVEIKTYRIIYELIEEVKRKMSELLEPEIKRIDLGHLSVLAIFKINKKNTVFGGRVGNGKMVKGENIEILRANEIIASGKLTQLQHNKEDVSEVKGGLECGLSIDQKVRLLPGDKVICFKEEIIKRKIS